MGKHRVEGRLQHRAALMGWASSKDRVINRLKYRHAEAQRAAAIQLNVSVEIIGLDHDATLVITRTAHHLTAYDPS